MLKRNWKIFFVGISQVVDILAMLASAGLVVWLKHYPHLGTQSANDVLLTGFLIFVGMYISIAVMMGLYRGSFHLSLSLQNMIMVRGFILCTLITLTITSLMKNLYIDRRALIVFLFSLPFFFVIGRVLLRRVNLFFQRLGFGVHNSLIVGYEHDSFNIFRRFNSLPELGYKIKGFVAKTTNPVSSLQPQFTFDQLEETIEDYSIDRVFIPTSDMVVNDYTNLKQISENQA
jgi:FlaA1/EpsC-like NDP-sugar epimerase